MSLLLLQFLLSTINEALSLQLLLHLAYPGSDALIASLYKYGHL